MSSYMRAADVCSALGICDETLRRWIRGGKFPAPTYFSHHFRAWEKSRVMPLIEELRPDR